MGFCAPGHGILPESDRRPSPRLLHLSLNVSQLPLPTPEGSAIPPRPRGCINPSGWQFLSMLLRLYLN